MTRILHNNKSHKSEEKIHEHHVPLDEMPTDWNLKVSFPPFRKIKFKSCPWNFSSSIQISVFDKYIQKIVFFIIISIWAQKKNDGLINNTYSKLVVENSKVQNSQSNTALLLLQWFFSSPWLLSTLYACLQFEKLKFQQ